MRIEDFPRPKADNRRGIHWSASVYHPSGPSLDFWLDELQAMKIKWVKVLDDGGGSSLEVSQRLLAADIMPVVRLYRSEPNPGTIGGREEETIRRLVAAGVRYFETNNEPDLAVEWKGGQVPPNWLDIVIDNFIVDADKVLALGGLPALPAMAVGTRVDPVAGIVARGRKDLFEKGAWIAVHNYTLNHPLDYPYDPVNQEGQPVSQEEYDRLGPWAWEGIARDQINAWRASDKNPGDTLEDDASCFLSFQLVDQLARAALGFPVPLISTEGGPVVGWREDRRYPRNTPDLHRERTVQIAEYMQGTRQIHGQNCPGNYFAACHWLIANYRMGFVAPGWESQSWYTDWWNKDFNLHGELPVVAALKALPSEIVDGGGAFGIAGKVSRADTDEPLPDLAVQLLRSGQVVTTTTTGADGTFSFTDLASGAYDLAIPPWGIVRRGVNAVEGPVTPVQIRLTGGRTSVLSGTIQSAAGAAVPGLDATLSRDGELVAQMKTGADGGFRFEGLPLGNYRLALPGITVDAIALDGWQAKSIKLTTGTAAGYRYTVTDKRLLTPEETNNRRLFYGVVSDAAGAPLNGVKVQMSWEGAAAGTQFPVKITGGDAFKPAGYFEFLHTPGVFTLQVVQADWPSDAAGGLDTANVAGREGQAVTYEVNFRLKGTGTPAQLDGVIGGGTAGRKITLGSLTAGTPARQTVLASNGAFAFPNVAPGPYRLTLEGIGVIADKINIAEGDLFRTLFTLRSRLSGKVIGAVDGMMAVLYAPAPWNWTRQAPLAPDGSFVFEGLPPGRYRLSVNGQTVSDLALTGENRLAIPAIDIAAGQRSVIRGRVADGEGQPKADRVVTLRREGVIVGDTRTAADGSYRFANLPAGTYSVEVTGLGQVATNIILDGEREVVADVLWPSQGPRGILQGKVLTANGAPRPHVLVRLLKDGAEVSSMTADSTGTFKFSGLAAGVYALAVGDGEPILTGIEVTDDATVVRDVTMPAEAAKVIAHYLLFGQPPAASEAGYAEAKLILGLASHYLTGDVAGGFSLAEASSAERVTIVGERVPANAETVLAGAGCQVARLSGDAYSIASALEQLFAEG
jgi:hypothetical protein